MQLDAQVFSTTSSPKTNQKPMAKPIALRGALSVRDFCYLPALGLEPREPAAESGLLLPLVRTWLGEIVDGSQAEGHFMS